MAEPRFVIGGTEYPVPEWISFTMDESEILYAKARLTLDQADDDIVFSPGLLSALMLIAYMRGNPGVSRKAAEKIIGAIPLTEAIEHLAGDDEDEADDAAPSQGRNETSELAPPANSVDSTPSSGFAGGNGSGSQVVPLPATGTPASVTPSTSDQATLVRSPPIS